MRRLNRFSVAKTDCFFLFLFFLYTYVAILNDSLLNVSSVYRYIKWGVTLAGIILFFYSHRGVPSVKELVFALTVMIAFFIAVKATGRTYLILYALFIILAESSEPDKTVRIWLLSTVAALLTILFLCGIGVLTDHLFLYPSGRACHCLGFGYYADFPYLVFCCSIAYIYLKKNNVSVYHYALVILVNLFMYRLTTVKLTFLLTFIFIAIDCLLVKTVKLNLKQKPVMVMSCLLFPLGAFATYFVMRNYNPKDANWITLNKVLEARPDLMHRGYLRYPVSLFGNRFEMVGNSAFGTVAPEDYFYIDSGFAYSLLGYGLIFTFVAVVLYSIIYLYSCETNNKHLFAWLTCILLFTMMNNIWVDVYYNPALMLSFVAFMEISKRKNRPQETAASLGSLGSQGV